MERGNPGPKHPPGVTREAVRELRRQGLSKSQIAAKLIVGRSTVAFHIRRLGLPVDEQFGRRYDWDQIRKMYESGASYRECQRRFGFSRDSWNYAVSRGDIVLRDWRIPLEELLVVGRKTSRGHLKRRLIEAGLKQNCCERCGLTEWNGEPLSMQLHHKNGDGLDNRLENLELLCPNCHSLTDTYGGRNGHRKPRLADDDLEAAA